MSGLSSLEFSVGGGLGLLAAALITGGDVLVRRARAEDLDAVLIKMRAAGAQITAERDGLRLSSAGQRGGKSEGSERPPSHEVTYPRDPRNRVRSTE